MASVSIILPTFNRADVLPRALQSVEGQTFRDWELIVVDDGSTDATESLVRGRDSRIRLIHQENQGCYVARNTGLLAASAKIITFLDSDDEWLPHYLELVWSFFRWSPDDHFLMTEFLDDDGSGRMIRNDWDLFANRWRATARRVGSTMLDLPPEEVDDYLRVYTSREELPECAQVIARQRGQRRAFLYRGSIYEWFRWGHMGWLPTTAVTRQALTAVGPFRANYRSAADYLFLAALSRTFRANMIAIPSAIKHDRASDGHTLTQGHLATGGNEYTFALRRLQLYDEVFFTDPTRRADPELMRIRAHYLMYAGRKALASGRRTLAIEHLSAACALHPSNTSAVVLLRFANLCPSDTLAASLYGAVGRVRSVARRLGHHLGRLAPGRPDRAAGDLARRLRRRMREWRDTRLDRRYGLDTAGILDDLALVGVPAASRRHAHGYEPIQLDTFDQMLTAAAVTPSAFTFVDFGSGKGRAVILAAAAGFGKVIGVEIAPGLHAVAQRNLEQFQRRGGPTASVRLVCQDAADFPIPDEPLVCFFYNPFDEAVMERVLTSLDVSHARRPRPILVLYRNPVHRAVLGRCAFLRPLVLEHAFCVYVST